MGAGKGFDMSSVQKLCWLIIGYSGCGLYYGESYPTVQNPSWLMISSWIILPNICWRLFWFKKPVFHGMRLRDLVSIAHLLHLFAHLAPDKPTKVHSSAAAPSARGSSSGSPVPLEPGWYLVRGPHSSESKGGLLYFWRVHGYSLVIKIIEIVSFSM